MIAKVGAAARDSRSATPRAAALPLPAQAPAVSRWAAIIVADPRLSSNIFFMILPCRYAQAESRDRPRARVESIGNRIRNGQVARRVLNARAEEIGSAAEPSHANTPYWLL
jgi:hypothetical protein